MGLSRKYHLARGNEGYNGTGDPQFPIERASAKQGEAIDTLGLALNLTHKSRPDYRYSGNRNHKVVESAQRNEKCSLLPFVRLG
jgi:hypothetical protein